MDVTDHSPNYKTSWAQWNLLEKDEVLDITGSRMIYGQKNQNSSSPQQGEHYAEFMGRHLGINETLDMVRKRYSWSYIRSDTERWCQQCHICAANRGLQYLQLGGGGDEQV
jgi:hypothetical protein